MSHRPLAITALSLCGVLVFSGCSNARDDAREEAFTQASAVFEDEFTTHLNLALQNKLSPDDVENLSQTTHLGNGLISLVDSFTLIGEEAKQGKKSIFRVKSLQPLTPKTSRRAPLSTLERTNTVQIIFSSMVA